MSTSTRRGQGTSSLAEARAALSAECLRRLSALLARPVTDADLDGVRRALERSQERERATLRQLQDAVRVLFDAAKSTDDYFFRELAVDLAKTLGRHSLMFADLASPAGPVPSGDRGRLVYTVGRSPTFLGSLGPATETQLALLFLALKPDAVTMPEPKSEAALALAIDDAIAVETANMSKTRNRYGWPSVRDYFEKVFGVSGDPRSWPGEEEQQRALEALVKELGE